MCFRYIVGFYRAEQKSVWDSVRTVFSLHNETGNVWTHFLGIDTMATVLPVRMMPSAVKLNN